jgi:hypothetical protein
MRTPNFTLPPPAEYLIPRISRISSTKEIEAGCFSKTLVTICQTLITASKKATVFIFTAMGTSSLMS